MANKKTNKTRQAVRERKADKRQWRAAFDQLRSEDVTYEALKKIEKRSKSQVADTRRRIPVNDIVVAEKVFQWRGRYSNLEVEDAHMRELIRALEIQDLQAITVFTLGNKPYVIDGHHRLAAYAESG